MTSIGIPSNYFPARCMATPSPTQSNEDHLAEYVDREPSETAFRIADLVYERPVFTTDVETDGETLEDAIHSITDEEIAHVCEVPWLDREEHIRYHNLLRHLQQLALPNHITIREARAYVWQEWADHLMQVSVPVLTLIPHDERQQVLDAIMLVLDRRRPV
jgi:hypothetical protein